jgi:D-alanyl-D-alanine carboxypeptidase/D-alanyl-D-alanine-endopeptidase (penicillin-binding protein 4)
MRRSCGLLFLLGLCFSQPLGAQTSGSWVEKQVGAWYPMALKLARGRWGVAVADQRGTILWSTRLDVPFVPASTVKLLTTGFARSLVGGDARRETRVIGVGQLSDAGEWKGRWWIEMNGDVTLERLPGTGPMLRDLAAQLRLAGIRHLRGPLELSSQNGVADAVYPAVWSIKHRGRSFAPLVGPLMFHENIVLVGVSPGSKAGSRAVLVSASPRGLSSMVTVRAMTRSGRRTRLSLSQGKDGRLVVNGTIGTRSRQRTLLATMVNPKQVLDAVWAQALTDEGITWDRTGTNRVMTSDASRVLALVQSAVFDSVASEINRRSLNPGAELLLQWAAGRGDSAAARLTAHVASITGMPDAVHLVDGSGLSYDNRMTPHAFINYLARYPLSPAGRALPMLLPANGSGTLHRLSSGLPGTGVVRAKTGTLAQVSNVVGYLGRPNGVLLIALMYEGPRPEQARQAEWRLFRILGADGVLIPAEGFVLDDAHLGGDSDSLGAVAEDTTGP